MKKIFLSLVILSLIFISGCNQKKSSNPSKIVIDTSSDFYRAPADIDSPDIVEAIKEGNFQKVREMVKKDPDVASGVITYPCEYYDWSLLLVSVRFNNKDISELLIKSGADVIRNGYFSYETPLHIAAEYNAKDVAELLIKYGANVNAEASVEQTPLHTAAYHNSKEVAEILIANGARLDARDYFCGCHRSGNTPLHYAVWGGSKDVIRLLVEKGADINETNLGDDHRDTPLYTAVKYDKKEVYDLLIELGASAKDWPLHYAVYEGNMEKVKNLVEVEGMDVNSRSYSKETPLHHVKDLEIARYLLKKGADVKAGNYYGYMAKTPEIAKLLISYGAKVTSGSLFRAKNKRVAEILINNGADVNAKDDSDMTPLHQFSERGNKEMVELLISKGAKLNVKEDLRKRTPLQMALEKGQNDVVKLLAEKGADTTYSLLYIENDKLKKEVVELLIKKGADVNIKREYCSTPLHIAIGRGNKDLVELFINKGANPYPGDGTNPLHSVRTLEVAEYLIVKGFNVKAKAKNGNTPLHTVSVPKIARLFVEKGADINARNAKGETPLFNHNILNQEKKTEIYIKLGAKVNVKNNGGETPLDRTQDIRVERLLIKSGADGSRYPFHYAILMEDMAQVKKFISEGVDIKRKGKNFTPIEYAVFTGNMDMVKLLVNKKADLVENNPLFMAIAYDRVEIAEFLIKKGAEVNAIITYNDEYTLLDIARSKEMRDLLVKYGGKNRITEKIRMF